MTIGRSNRAASDTLTSVSWNVERFPNSDRNCFARTSREAGHSRVFGTAAHDQGNDPFFHPRPALDPVILTIPFRKTGDTFFNGCRRPETDVALELGDIGVSRFHVTGLHRQHFLRSGSAEFFF